MPLILEPFMTKFSGELNSFPRKVIDELKYYVYRLIDLDRPS
jgi:hypothetical protein